jgi:hypothetical protein
MIIFIVMGRKKIYESEHERHEAEKRRKREWYKRNSEHVRRYRMDNYRKQKDLDKKVSLVQ